MNLRRTTIIILIIFLLIGIIVISIWGLYGIGTMLIVIGAICAFIAYIGLQDFSVLIIFALPAIGLIWGGIKIRESQEDDKLYKEIMKTHSLYKMESFVRSYHSSPYFEEVEEMYFLEMVNQMSPKELSEYIKNHNNEHCSLAQTKLEKLCDSLYNIAEQQNTMDGWREYQSFVPEDYYYDSKNRMAQIESERWETDKKAWEFVTEHPQLSSYKKYLKLYPKGVHKREAIEAIVGNVRNGEHGNLPGIEQIGWGYGSSSTINISNNTSYELTIYYSGKECEQLIIPAHVSNIINLKNGSYQVVASVNARGVRNYYGIEMLDGGEYSVSYYIQTTRY